MCRARQTLPRRISDETTNDRRSAPPQGAAISLEAWIPGHLRNGCLAATLAVPKTGAE